ncbi:MAG: hypothetical protein KTV68_15925 [Acidimicrobiia bacterium]|nr:hypothetical protein [Acidimicrobiia bacterium]
MELTTLIWGTDLFFRQDGKFRDVCDKLGILETAHAVPVRKTHDLATPLAALKKDLRAFPNEVRDSLLGVVPIEVVSSAMR